MINIEEDLQEILTQAGLNAEQRSKVLKIAKEVENAKKEDKDDEKTPKGKNKFTIFIRGDAELAKKVATGWITKSPLDQDDNEAIERLQRAAKSQNEVAKRKKNPIKTWADLFKTLKSKSTKTFDTNVAVSTKDPVRVVVIEQENAL